MERCFFLNSTGISQDNVASVHQPNERIIGKWLGQVHIGTISESVVDRLLNVWIQMNRVNECNVRMLFAEDFAVNR